MPKKHRATFIKEWRNFRKLSQEALGELIGMTGGNLSLLERGIVGYTQDTLERLADALDCETIDLLTRDPKDPDGIWTVWKEAKTARQKRQIVELARTVLKIDSE